MITSQGHDPPTLSYAQSGANSRPRFRLPRFSILACLAVAAPIFCFYFVIELCVPHIETIYHDFGTPLPPSTQLLLDIARPGAQNLLGIPYFRAAIIPIACGFLAPLLIRNPSRLRRNPLIVLLLIANTALLMALITALLVLVDPLFHLLRTLTR